jgi:hypothetical protein
LDILILHEQQLPEQQTQCLIELKFEAIRERIFAGTKRIAAIAYDLAIAPQTSVFILIPDAISCAPSASFDPLTICERG